MPLKILVAETIAPRFLAWACFALFFLLSRSWAAALFVNGAFGEVRATFPDFETRLAAIRISLGCACVPFAASFIALLVACLDLNGLFCWWRHVSWNHG